MPSYMILKTLFLKNWSTKRTSMSRSKKTPPPKLEPNICRVCLGEGTIAIFNNAAAIAQDIIDYGKVQISEKDQFPKHICQNCYQLLQSAILFRKYAHESNAKLLNKNGGEIPTEMAALGDLDQSGKTYTENKSDDHIKRYNCEKCHLSYCDYFEYSKHLQTVEHRKAKVLCPKCNQLVNNLRVHIQCKHNEEEHAFICDVCGKRFKRETYLKSHIARHSQDLPYQCEKCPYRGRTHTNLRMHIICSHTKDMLYVCEHCPRRFNMRSNLDKHTHRHHTTMPYKCENCNRGYHTKNTRDEHYNAAHLRLKQHSCDKCEMEFFYRKKLRLHQRRVHNAEKLPSGALPLYKKFEKAALSSDK